MCAAGGQAVACGELNLGLLGPLQTAIAWLGFIVLGGALLRSRSHDADGLRRFSLLILVLVFANALLCGALVGDFGRYQTRVEWLVPFAAFLYTVDWARRRRGATLRATLPSQVASIVAEPSMRAPP